MAETTKWAQAYWPDRFEALIVEMGRRLTERRTVPYSGGYENEQRDFIVGHRGVRTHEGYHDGFMLWVKEDATDAEEEWRSLYELYLAKIPGFDGTDIYQQTRWIARSPRGEDYFRVLLALLKMFVDKGRIDAAGVWDWGDASPPTRPEVSD